MRPITHQFHAQADDDAVCTCGKAKAYHPAPPPEPAEKRLPDAQGWWLRNHEGKLEWFYAVVFSDAPIGIWVKGIEEYMPVQRFTFPLTRWYGPIDTPLWASEAM